MMDTTSPADTMLNRAAGPRLMKSRSTRSMASSASYPSSM